MIENTKDYNGINTRIYFSSHPDAVTYALFDKRIDDYYSLLTDYKFRNLLIREYKSKGIKLDISDTYNTDRQYLHFVHVGYIVSLEWDNEHHGCFHCCLI